jgi:hypothetical protein
MRTVAASIELNPARAKIAEDPKDYRWSGYGEAVAGGEADRVGLTRLVKTEVGDDSGREWCQARCALTISGSQTFGLIVPGTAR